MSSIKSTRKRRIKRERERERERESWFVSILKLLGFVVRGTLERGNEGSVEGN